VSTTDSLEHYIAQLSEQSDLLSTVMGLAPAFISYVGLDSRYKLVCRHYLDYFGRPLNQIIGREMREIIGEDAWQQVSPAMQRALQGHTTEFQAHFHVPGRGERWSKGIYTPDIDKAGNVRGVVVWVNDITDQKRYERSLSDSDAFYRSIFESPGVANTEADPKTGIILRVNRLMCEMLGYTEAELLKGLTFLDITHPDDRERNRRLVAPLLRGDVDCFQIEKRYLRKDGSTVWVSVTVTTLKDSQGRTDRLLGAAQDITARVEAEQALRQSEERVRLAVTAAGIGYWTLDPKNDAGTLDDICARHFKLGRTPTGAQVLARIIPADRERVSKGLANSFKGEQPYHAEFRVEDSDGSYRWLMGLGGALKDAAGNVTMLSGINIDISARKLAEEEREKFVSLATNSSEFIAMCDRAGRIFFLNDAARAMSGYDSLRDAQAYPIWELFFIEERELLKRELFERAYTSGREEIETRIRNVGTSESRWVMLNVSPVRDTAEQIVGLAVMGRDITERKNAERELTEAAKRKDEFLATLAHELRNPLAPISNALQVWPRVVSDPERLEGVRQMMNRQVQQLKHLIDDLLDVSRISQGKIQLRRERLELSSVLESAIESVRPVIDQAHHTLRVHYPPQSVVIEGDRGRLNQIFGNLIHNAAKYSKASGQIDVEIGLHGAFVEVTVRDTGIGIPTEMLAHIFEPFRQIHASRGMAQGGIGIGLALVKNLVSLHGGEIEAHSEGLGQGSSFVVKLPLAPSVEKAVEKGAAANELAGAAAPAISHHRILIVDDERSSADTLSLMLEALGQETMVAYDAQSAITLARSYHPEIVFSDIAMPGMDGLQLARELRVTGDEPPTLVAVTGYGQEQDRRRTQEAGFHFHLVKPTSLSAVREIILKRAVKVGQNGATG
jgi:PAS domain S-box-containing protein